jgi:hypothetical protein
MELMQNLATFGLRATLMEPHGEKKVNTQNAIDEVKFIAHFRFFAGYFRIKRGANVCGIENLMLLPC